MIEAPYLNSLILSELKIQMHFKKDQIFYIISLSNNLKNYNFFYNMILNIFL